MNQYNFSGSEDTGHIGNSESLYSKVQRVYLKSRHKEERQRDLRVSVDVLTGLSPVCKQNLSLQLTDDDDPFFLYSLLITEEDFKSLKSQQGLLVDFDHFPSQFVRLLDMCKNASASSGPTFLLILDGDERDSIGDTKQIHLKIVETNHFKHLCHLDLRIGGGSDMEIKKLMASKIKHLKDLVTMQEKELTQTSSQLKDCIQRFELKCREVDEQHQQWNEEKNNLFTQHLTALTKEREKLSAAQFEWKIQSEKDKRDIDVKHQNIMANLESQLAELTAQNQILFEKNCQGECTKRERSSRVDILEKELASAQREIVSLRKQNSKLDLDYHEKEKLSNNLRTRLAVFEQEVKDKAILHNKQQELLRNANEQKLHLEDGLRERDITLQRKQASLKSLSDELVKANEILTKLQAELLAVKSKLKLRTNIALEQEKLLSTKQQALLTAQNKVIQLEQQIKDLETSDVKLRESLTAAEAKIEAKDKQIRNDDNVIHWLNRQLSGVHSESLPPGFSSTPLYQQHPFHRRTGPETHSSATLTAPVPTPSVLHSSLDPKHLNRLPLPTENSEARRVATKAAEPKLPVSNNVLLSKRIQGVIQPAISSAYFPKSTPT